MDIIATIVPVLFVLVLLALCFYYLCKTAVVMINGPAVVAEELEDSKPLSSARNKQATVAADRASAVASPNPIGSRRKPSFISIVLSILELS